MFKFLVSQFVTAGVECSAFSDLAPLVRESLEIYGGGDFPLSAVVIFPTILNPEIMVRGDYLSYRKNDNACYIGVNVNYFDWISASKVKKIQIASEVLRSAIKKIPPNRLGENELEVILMAIDWAEIALRSN